MASPEDANTSAGGGGMCQEEGGGKPRAITHIWLKSDLKGKIKESWSATELTTSSEEGGD